MSQLSMRTHPLIVIAATTVILTCLLAIGIMVGIIPSPLAKDRAAAQEDVSANTSAAAAKSENRSGLTDSRSGANAPAAARRERATERSAVGSTSGTAPSQTVRGGGSAPKVAAVCTNCGTVTSVRAVTRQGEAGLVGPIAGGALGGAIGSQIGGGSGKTIATIVGAAGGAAVGTEVERRYKATTDYVVGVRLNDGTTRSFTYDSAPGFREGERVRIVEGRLVRES